MGGSYITVYGRTREEVQARLNRAICRAEAIGLTDVRSQNIIEIEADKEESQHPAIEIEDATWCGGVHVHS